MTERLGGGEEIGREALTELDDLLASLANAATAEERIELLERGTELVETIDRRLEGDEGDV